MCLLDMYLIVKKEQALGGLGVGNCNNLTKLSEYFINI